MLIDGTHYRSIWLAEDTRSVLIIDQRRLPFDVEVETIRSYREMVRAIREMHLRGAPLIGAAAAYGVYLACLEFAGLQSAGFNSRMDQAIAELDAARPTAVNLRWALERQRAVLAGCVTVEQKIDSARRTADAIAEQDVEICRGLGNYGAELLASLAEANRGRSVQVLTHCNAGWLATVDYGTVTAVLYEASRRGIPLHVWVDETRPRNQGALTSWELGHNGVANTVICDNAGGHLMQHGLVDLVLVGTDRTARNGDVANKIGTYLKALAAHDNRVPFYVALPSPSFDADMSTGVGAIPIEERDPQEVLQVRGLLDGSEQAVALFAEGTSAANYAFDVTPARLVSGYITEYGVFDAAGLAQGIATAGRRA
ncbi:MAG: S-methyl-5-thioribose-1-phosphate isomerase [Spirochaetaceae bacterium]|nr:MAG: S-methyl-5-thioribose-1-phosphate isomerase [Spirochaetaceae bacterium]